MLALVFLLFLVLARCDGNTWAVLVAGSKSYENFRHQADICEAYHQLHAAGIPDERIIVFMYDDIAHSIQNPHKGSIINYPGGPNVYPGVPHDYTGIHVSPSNFLKVLKGEAMTAGSKKTLKSDANDNVFVYFADHGGPGILCFPFQMFESLHAKDLIKTIEEMSDKKMFKKLVFYVEACESGSIFDGLLKTPNVYAVTASNPTESSWACDYDSKYSAYLNDCWSNDWMNDSRIATSEGEFNTRTLNEQFEAVQIVSSKSPECRYGDFSYINDTTLAMIQGQPGARGRIFPKTTRTMSSNPRSTKFFFDQPYYMKYLHLVNRFEKESTDEAKMELTQYLSYMASQDTWWNNFKNYFDLVETRVKSDDTCHVSKPLDLDCMKAVVQSYERSCGRWDEYKLKYAKFLRSVCDMEIPMGDYLDYVAKNC